MSIRRNNFYLLFTKMLAIFLFYGSSLLILKVLAVPPKPTIFDKFSQDDYKLKFEHLDIDSYNENVFKEVKLVTFKYNRTYAACNVSAELKVDLNSDVEAIVQTYKFASNEYRLFPLRFQVNACFAVHKNLAGLGRYSKCGNFSGCPLKKEIPMHACNWRPDESRFPPFIPTGRYMLHVQFLYGSTEIGVVKGYGEVFRPIDIPK